MNLSFSLEDALILQQVLKNEAILKTFNDLVKIYVEQNGVSDKEARSIIFPEFAKGAINAYKEKMKEQ